MSENLAGKTFDVQTRLEGRWTTENLHASRSQALAQAEALVGKGEHEAVRVIAESERAGVETIFEQDLGVLQEKPVQVVAVDTAAPCADLDAFYGFESRRTIGRVMRHYLDREGVTALELVFDSARLMMLERDDRLFPSAVQRVAAIQAKRGDGSQVERSDALYRFVEQAKEHARDTVGADQIADVLATDGLDAGITAARAQNGGGRLFDFALARVSARHGDWAAKLGALADLADGAADADALGALDAAVAELLDGAEAVGDLLGGAADLGEATRTLVRLATGRAADTRGASAHFLAVNALFGNQSVPLSRGVMYERVAGNLRGTRSLTRDNTDADSLALLVRDCTEEAGLCGGPAVSGAIVRRARLALRDGVDDLDYADALDRVVGLLPHVLVRLGFVLDMAADAGWTDDDSAMTMAEEAFDRVLEQIEQTAAVFPYGTSMASRRAVADGLTARAASEAIPVSWRPRIEAALRAVAKATAELQSAPPIPENHVRTIAMTLETVQKPAGEVLFEEGEPGGTAFLIRRGEIEIVRTVGDEETILGRIGRGELVGEIALIDGLPRSATARVTKDVDLVVITREELEKRLSKVGDQDMVVRRLIDVLVRRVRGRASALE